MTSDIEYLRDRFDGLERTLRQVLVHTAQLDPLVKRLDDHIAADQLLFHGNGNGSPGLVKEVDRLKQWRKLFTGAVSILATAAVAELAKLLWWG